MGQSKVGALLAWQSGPFREEEYNPSEVRETNVKRQRKRNIYLNLMYKKAGFRIRKAQRDKIHSQKKYDRLIVLETKRMERWKFKRDDHLKTIKGEYKKAIRASLEKGLGESA